MTVMSPLEFAFFALGYPLMGVFAYWWTRRDVIQIINELKADLPTSLNLLGKAMFKSVKSSEGAALSADTRLDKGLASRMVDDFLGSQSPLAKMALDYGKESIPYLREHPELLPQLITYAREFFGQKAPQSSNNRERFLGLGK